MKLNGESIRNRAEWEEKGYRLPAYDREAMIGRTRENPVWLHFGPGNIFKALHGMAAERLLNAGQMDRGITAVERMDRGDGKYDGLTVVVTLKADGSVEKNVLGAVAETCFLCGGEERLKEIFRDPGLQLVTFTITEKGYNMESGEVKADLSASPGEAESYLGRVAALLRERYRAGAFPLAMVSTDNCSHNGDKLKAAMLAFAEAWGDEGFTAYLEDRDKVSFPWTMIDKITPSPDPAVGRMLEADGLRGFEPVSNERGTVRAPYVNAEESEYLVLEDRFPNGRPPLEKAGFYFTDRETVDKVERMKVRTCLNPLHTALAVFGCLLGFGHIWEEMRDEDLRKLVEGIGYREGLPVVTDPGILDPKEFIDTVIRKRFSNPFVPDTPQRIATDTSQKLPIRFGETIKAYLMSDTLDAKDLRLIPLVFAGWIRYLMAVDDRGNAFQPSPDPLLKKAQGYVKDFRLGEKPDCGKLTELLRDRSIFGADLMEAGLSERVCGYLEEMTKGPGAVRETLRRAVTEEK
ncbi:MAG: mannitol dehydrogenase family protein [Clostridia bacterium]|nr:mannitol dehydrogenase family protein [Clostridia bacterium]